MTRSACAWLSASSLLVVVLLGCNTGKRSLPSGTLPTSAPALVDSDPADGATLVPTGQTIQARFSTELHPDSLAPGVRLVDVAGREVVGRASLVAPRTVAFDPLGPLPGGTSFRLRLTTDLHGLTGLPLGAPVEVRFRTESAVRAGSVLLNEIYPGLTDSNGLPAGNVATDEQFVELVNVSPEPLNLLGLVLSTTSNPRAHVFDSLVLPSGAAVVVWAKAPMGPGNVQASGGALRIVLTTGYRVKLTSTELAAQAPETVDEVVFPSTLFARPFNTRESVTRQVDAAVGDLPGGTYVRHPDAPGAIGGFSPGRRVNGIPFATP